LQHEPSQTFGKDEFKAPSVCSRFSSLVDFSDLVGGGEINSETNNNDNTIHTTQQNIRGFLRLSTKTTNETNKHTDLRSEAKVPEWADGAAEDNTKHRLAATLVRLLLLDCNGHVLLRGVLRVLRGSGVLHPGSGQGGKLETKKKKLWEAQVIRCRNHARW